jgi:hypothetical protein
VDAVIYEEMLREEQAVSEDDGPGFDWFGEAGDTPPDGELQSAVFREATPEWWVDDADMAVMTVRGEVTRHDPDA